MHLLRYLWFFAATFDIHIVTEHIAGRNSCRADMLSRNHLTQFLLSNPQQNYYRLHFLNPFSTSYLHRDQTGHQVPLDNVLQILSLWCLPCYKIHLFIRPDKLPKLLLHDPTRPIPAIESTILLFVTHLTTSGLSHTTIKVYFSAVRSMYVATGQHTVFNQQHTPQLQQVLKGIQ